MHGRRSKAMTTTKGDILITGGTGQQGLAAFKELRRAGWGVRVLTRNPNSSAAQAAQAQGAELVVGNLADRAAVERAMAGAYGVFCVAPLATSFMPESAFEEQFVGTRNVVDAAVTAKVEHFVLSSANSADLKINPNLDNKFRMENYIRETSLRATFLRPVAFMDNFLLPQWGLHQGLFTTALRPETRQQLVAVADIAAFARIALEAPHKSGAQVLEIASDELTAGEMSEALSEALGYRVPCIHIATETLMTLNRNSALGYSKINAGAMRIVDLATLRAVHPGLLTFREWLRQGAADQIRALPRVRPGAYLQQSPAWEVSVVAAS